ncbi:hypothetical protein ETC05_01500 [Geobacillus sp. BMUD]|nr:hypothetical protein [Geobacillus sp. BMUD]
MSIFDCRRQATGLPPSRLGVTEDRTTACFTDPSMGLEAAWFGLPTVDPILGKSCKWESFQWHLYTTANSLIWVGGQWNKKEANGVNG